MAAPFLIAILAVGVFIAGVFYIMLRAALKNTEPPNSYNTLIEEESRVDPKDPNLYKSSSHEAGHVKDDSQ